MENINDLKKFVIASLPGSLVAGVATCYYVVSFSILLIIRLNIAFS
ncbi:hypothetical protein D1BOALGB6SA_6988 [Olavius sp. associated proteobacterium Delta 1]|nr:hypothetical protein D1BOALGB6SA_6988 [Olavius sp. associated proteobacterium Delta 1]